MFDSNKLRVPTIQQWEEAGEALASALSQYLDLCISLGPNSQKDGTPSKALATRIDSALKTLHAQLEQRVDSSRSILARTRNQVLSPMCYFPREILSEIFACVIFNPIDPSEPVQMKDGVMDIYQSLHSLLGVCSTWRSVVLARGSFWSVVPIMEPKDLSLLFRSQGKPLFTGLSLERSGSTDLHLAAIVSDRDLDVDFTKHISRFGSINILSESTFAIGKLLGHFLESGSPMQVSNLSLCLESNVPSNRIPPQRPYLSSLNPLKQTNFESFLESISVLLLSNIRIDWHRIKFSHRLAELELQNVTLGSDSKIISLLTSLSSATELRTLKLISVITYPNLFTHQNTTAKPIISLPKLQTMVARNLHFNTLDSLLSSITSRSHCLTLHLTRRTFEITPFGDAEPEQAVVQRVVDLFHQVTVNTLLLEAFEEEGSWLSPADIWEILHAMPEIKTLRMHDWDYHTEFCGMIQQPHLHGNFEFPRFKNIYLSQARIRDEEAFKNMVASYSASLERMELAGAVVKGSEDVGFKDYLEGGEPIVTWFEENVPNFELTSNYEVPPEFCAPVWQLW